MKENPWKLRLAKIYYSMETAHISCHEKTVPVFCRLLWKTFQCVWPAPTIFPGCLSPSRLNYYNAQHIVLSLKAHYYISPVEECKFSHAELGFSWETDCMNFPFSTFHNGVPMALYTSGWFVLAVFVTLLSLYIFLLANITPNTVSFSFFPRWFVFTLTCPSFNF